MLRPLYGLMLVLFALTAPAQTNQEIHPAKGVVIEVATAGKKVTIKHETIPGYMQAMTMPFDVKDTNELTGLAPGDVVTFRIVVQGNEGWIDQIQKTGATTNTPPTTGPFRAVRDVEPLNEGDVLPEYHFTNQLGQAFSTAQFKGQALAITFLFTRCPFPNFCPLMANNFSQTARKLLATPNAPTNWHLLTITFDPENDTPRSPARLRRSPPRRSRALDLRHRRRSSTSPRSASNSAWRFGKSRGASSTTTSAPSSSIPPAACKKSSSATTWHPEDLVAETLKAAKQ